MNENEKRNDPPHQVTNPEPKFKTHDQESQTENDYEIKSTQTCKRILSLTEYQNN